MKARTILRNEPAAAALLVSETEKIAQRGLIPMNLWKALRDAYTDAQTPRPDDPPIPVFYTR